MRGTRRIRSILLATLLAGVAGSSAACSSGGDELCYLWAQIAGADEEEAFLSCVGDYGEFAYEAYRADLRAYRALAASGDPTSPAAPSLDAFMAARYPDWEHRRAEIRRAHAERVRAARSADAGRAGR
jgi:hypothetical protein